MSECGASGRRYAERITDLIERLPLNPHDVSIWIRAIGGHLFRRVRYVYNYNCALRTRVVVQKLQFRPVIQDALGRVLPYA